MPSKNGHSSPTVHIKVTVVTPNLAIVAPNVRTGNQDIPIYIADSIKQWCKDNPKIKVRSTLPIVEHGFTSMAMIWFDEE